MTLGAIDTLVVRAPNWVGDLVMATPILEAVLEDARFGEVVVALRSHLAGVLEGGPCEQRLLRIPDRRAEVGLLRDARADAVLLLTSSMGAAWRSFRAGIPMRAGSGLGGRRWLLTHCVVPPSAGGRRVPIPTAHLLRDVAGLLGVTVPDLHPRLHVGEESRATMRRLLAERGLGEDEGYVVCAPGAAFGAAKLWPPEHHAAVLDALHERTGWRGVVTGGPGEEPGMRAVVAHCLHPVIDLIDAPRDLVLLKPLIADARMLLVGDSGPRWYAAAFDVPCVTIMGPNFPELTATSLEHCEVVRMSTEDGLDCSPCLQRVCPLEHHRCMKELAPALAIAAAERLLALDERTAIASAARA